MKKLMILIVSLVWLAPLVFSQEYESEDQGSVEPQYYDNAKVLRVKYTQGEAYVKRGYDEEGLEEAAVNLPVFEKDVAGTTDGRLEIYMGRLNYVRLDSDTEVVFDKVPELQKTDLSLKILRGGVYLDIENLDYERDIEVQTADCGVFLLDKGLYRVNVSEGGRTEVFVYDGVAEVAGNNSSRNVRENQKVVMFNGEIKERPFYFYSTEKDEFDNWNRERNNLIGYDRNSSSRYLDRGYEEYEYELSRQGNWKYDSTYNSYIWIPYSVADDWRPYYHGRWVWNPFYGYVWMSYDSWGYFTHHYGRWHWDSIYHWHWIPAYHWSPAWVSWSWDNDYYGWCPLSWWNRPVIIIDGHWWRNYDHHRHGIPMHARSTTIIRKSELSAAGIHHAALKKDALRQMSNKSLMSRGNAPDVKPVVSKLNVIDAKGNAVVYKRNGIVSTGKFRTGHAGTGISTVKGDKKVVYKYSGKDSPGEKVSKYSRSPYSSNSSGTTFTPKKYKYSSSGQPGDTTSTPKRYKYGSSSQSGGSEETGKSPGYKSTYKHKDDSGSGSSSSGSSSSGTSTVKRSPTKSSTSKSSSGSSSGSKTPKIKKKDGGPSYSYSPSGGSSSSSYSSSDSSPYSGKKYSYKSNSSSSYKSSRSYGSSDESSNSYKSYGNSSPSSSTSSPSYSYRSSSNKSSYKKPTGSYSRSSSSSSSSPSYSSKTHRESTSSYNSYRSPSPGGSSYTPQSYTPSRRSYSAPSSSYTSTPRSSSYSAPSSSYTPSHRSYSAPSSSNTPSHKSYSAPSSSHRSSSGSSISVKSSSGSSSSHRSSSSGSSTSTFKKKS